MSQGQWQLLFYSPGFVQLRTVEIYSNSEALHVPEEDAHLRASEFEIRLENQQ
jgi:hypothetical protein